MKVETEYSLDLTDFFAQLEKAGQRFAAFDDLIKQSADRNPLRAYAKQQEDFNKALGQQIQTTLRVQAQQQALRRETQLLEAEYKKLSAQRKGFEAAGRSQELLQKMQATRDRIREIKTALGEASEGVERVKKSGDGMVDVFGKAKNFIIGAFAVDKVLDFGKSVLDMTGKFEKFEAVLTNALGSRSAAKENLQLIADFAATTPYGVDEITESFIKFVNRGLTPTKEQLINIGDLAASQGKSLDQLTEAILDAQSGEFERLKEFGIRASKSGDQVTLAFKGVTQTVKATNTEITNAILGFGKLGGVAGGMNVVAQTLEGQISNLGDSFDRLLVALGDSGVAKGFKMALAAGGEFLGLLTDIIAQSPADELRKQQAELNGLVGAIALANDNEAVRLSLIQKLNQQYPEFLGKLDAESVTTDILAQRLATVNSLYEQKIRIALGEEKIKRANDALTASIRQQQEALQDLASASGKSIVELEKLSPAQRVALARQIGARENRTDLGMGVYGQSRNTYNAEVLESSAKRQAAAQKELNTLLADNARRQSDLTSATVKGYQAQIKQIQEKIKLRKIDKSIGEEEIKRLQSEIDRAQGVIKPPVIPPPKVDSKAIQKVLDEEKKALMDAQEDYLKEYQRLETEFGKDRLEALKKDGAEYINAKAELDQKALKLERDAFEKRLQLATSSQTREVNGKRVAVPNTAVTLENALPEIAQAFSDRQQRIEADRVRQLQLSRIREEYKLLELAKKSSDSELELFDKYWEEKLATESEGGARLASLESQRDAARKIVADKESEESLAAFDEAWRQIIAKETANDKVLQALITKRNRDRNTLVVGEILAQNKRQEEISLAFIDTDRYAQSEMVVDPTLNAEKLEMNRQKARLEVMIRAGKERLKLLKEQNEAENATLIIQTEAAVDQLEEQQRRLTANSPKFRDIYDLLGLTDGMNAEQMDAFRQGLQQISDAIRQTTQLIVEETQKRIQALDAQIAAKEEQIRIEEERDKEGTANNLKLRKLELENLKAQKAEEEATRRKALKVQQALDAASSLSNAAVAVSNGIAFLTNLSAQMIKLGPIAGPIAFFATLASMTAAIFASVTQLKNLARPVQLRKGKRIPISGRSHEQGGHRIEGTDIEVERGEWVVNARSSEEYDDVLESINKNNPHMALRNLLKHVGLPEIVVQRVNQPGFGKTPTTDLSVLKSDMAGIHQRLDTLIGHAAELPKSQMTGLGDGRVIERTGGKTIITDHGKKQG